MSILKSTLLVYFIIQAFQSQKPSNVATDQQDDKLLKQLTPDDLVGFVPKRC